MMKCNACGEENVQGNKFCQKCGSPLAAAPPAAPVGQPTAAPQPVTPQQPTPTAAPLAQQPAPAAPAAPQPQASATPQQAPAAPQFGVQQPTAPQQAPYGQPAQQAPYGQAPQQQYGAPYGQQQGGYYPGQPAPQKKKGKGLIIGIIAAVLVVAITVGVLFLTGVLGGGGSTGSGVYNDSKPMYSGGLYSQNGNKIYYMDPDACLRMANVDGSESVLLHNDFAYNINVSNNYLFFVDYYDEVHRMNLDGTGDMVVSTESTWWLAIHNEVVYAAERPNPNVDDNYNLVSYDLNGGNRKVLYTNFDPLCIVIENNKIYFIDYSDDITEMNLDGSGQRVIYTDSEYEIYHFVVLNDAIYYVSRINSVLCRIDIATGARTEIMDCDKESAINVYKGELYILTTWDSSYNATLYRYNPATGGSPQQVTQLSLGSYLDEWVKERVYMVGDYLYIGTFVNVRYNMVTGELSSF